MGNTQFPEVRKYVKTAPVEAVQYTGRNGYEIERWATVNTERKIIESPILEPTTENPLGVYLQIFTREGGMTAVPGCWIARGVEGEFWAIQDSIFKVSYILAEDVQPTARAAEAERKLAEALGRECALREFLAQCLPQGGNGVWWCPQCQCVADPTEVTSSEHHQACGAYLGNTTPEWEWRVRSMLSTTLPCPHQAQLATARRDALLETAHEAEVRAGIDGNACLSATELRALAGPEPKAEKG